LLGIAIDRGIVPAGARDGFRASMVRAFILLPFVVILGIASAAQLHGYRSERAEHRGWPGKDLEPVCAFIDAHSRLDDRLFIWGFSPDIYITCRRKPASRFVYTTMVAGLVPWFIDASHEQDDARAVPGARAQLIADLEATRPPVLVDAPATLGNRSIEQYEVLREYVEKRYCTMDNIGEMRMYILRDTHANCPMARPRAPDAP
jgi:hypothetical protein